jgi:hypothetical protein
MDPFTAFGLVVGCLQLVQQGQKIYKRSGDIIFRPSKVLEANEEIKARANELWDLIEDVVRAQDRWQRSRGSVELDENGRRIKVKAEESLQTSRKLVSFLQELAASKDPTVRYLDNVVKAFKSKRNRRENEALDSRLDNHRKDLLMLLGVANHIDTRAMRDEAHKHDAKTEDHLNILLEEIQCGLGKQIETGADVAEIKALLLSSTIRWRQADQASHGVTVQTRRTTILHEAAQAWNVVKVRQLLRSGTIGVNDKDENGRAALHHARSADVVKELFREDWDPKVLKDIQDDKGLTALHHAARDRRLTVLRALL